MALRCPTGSSIRRSLIFDPNSRSSFFGNICTSTFSACPVQNIFHLLLGYIAPGDTTPWWGTSSTIWYDTPTGHRLYPSILSSKKVQQNCMASRWSCGTAFRNLFLFTISSPNIFLVNRTSNLSPTPYIFFTQIPFFQVVDENHLNNL